MRSSFLCTAILALVISTMAQMPLRVFKSVDELQKTIKNTINVSLDQVKSMGGGLFHAHAMFAGINVTLQFQWPFGANGTVRLQRNQLYIIPNFKIFTKQIGSQLGKNVSLPMLEKAGIGNNGFSIVTLEFQFQEKSLHQVQVKFNIPGLEILSAYYLKILHPQVVMKFEIRSQNVYSIKAVGGIVGDDSVNILQVIPIEIYLPQNKQETLKVIGSNRSSEIPFKYLHKFFTVSQGLNLPGISTKILQNVIVKDLEIVFQPGMAKLSNFTFEAVMVDPWKIGLLSLDNARLSIIQSGVSFSVDMTFGNATLHLSVPQEETEPGYTLKLKEEVEVEDLAAAVNNLFHQTLLSAKVSVPDFVKIYVFGTKLKVQLSNYEVAFPKSPSNLVNISLAVRLPKPWGIFGNLPLSTNFLDISFRLTILSLNGSTVVTSAIKGIIELGDPIFLKYPFHMDIPHNAQSLSVTLQSGKQFNIDFGSLLKAGGSYQAPNLVKRLLQNFNVTITKLALVFPLEKNKDPFVDAFELKSNKIWNLKLIQLVDVSIKYFKNRHEISGGLEFLGLKIQAKIKWPPKLDPNIRIGSPLKLGNLVQFCNRLSSHFLKNKVLELDMKGFGLINITDVTLQSLDIALSQDGLKVKDVRIKISFPKYSWKLFKKFFEVKNVIASINVVIGKSFSMAITGDMTLLDGALKIPLLIKVPLPSAETIIVKAFATKKKAAVLRLRDILVLFKSLVSIEFPTILADFLPQIRMEQFEVSFPKSLTKVENVVLSARCLSSWDIGGRGILTVNNLHLNASYKFYEVCGIVRIGRVNLPVRFIANQFQEPLFQLVKPVTISNFADFIATTFKQLMPQIKEIPNGNLLELNNAIVQLQKVDIFFSRDLKSFIGFDIKVMIPNKWDLFRNFFTFKHVSFKLKVTDLSAEANIYYEFAISGIMELFKNGKTVEFPFRCNIPSSSTSLIHLMLASPVNIELSDVLLIPLVQKVIPRELISPISELLGPIRVEEISVYFKTQKPLQVSSFSMSILALKVWGISGLPVVFQNISLKMYYTPSKVSALLSGVTMIKNHPINIEIPFPRNLNFVLIRFQFKDLVDLSLNEMMKLLVPKFNIVAVFPTSFSQAQATVEKFDLLVKPPLTGLHVFGCETKFKLSQTVVLVKDWLLIKRISVDMKAYFQGKVNVDGQINCSAQFGSNKNNILLWSTLTIPSPPSNAWAIKINRNSDTSLSLTKLTTVLLGGIDVKSLFPSKILAKVTDIKLVDLQVTFRSQPSPHVQRVKVLLETNLVDVWLPIKISIQKVQLDIDVLYKDTKSKPVVQSHLAVWIKVGKEVIQTTLSMKDNEFHLQVQDLGKQALDIFDLADLVGGSQLLRVIPKPFMKFKEATINKLSLTFTKADFKLKDVYVLCNLNGFDAGFEFPILGLNNIVRAHLEVSTIELVKKNTWVLKAEIETTISGIYSKIDQSLKGVLGILTITPDDSPTLELKKTIADISVNTKLAGIELALNIKVLNPKLSYSQSDRPEITVDLEVTGFDKINDGLPFDVFVNQLNMSVVIKNDKERPVGIRLKNLPIRNAIIPCKDHGKAEYKCDFTWLCNHDSYVYLKSPTLFYTKEGFEASVEMKGIDKLCIPITPSFLWSFIKKIPILGNMFSKNIPLWPPPNLRKILSNLAFDINNLPKGMQRFIDPKFPKQIFTSIVVGQEGPMSMSIKVGNGESLNICFPNGPLMSGFVLREFTMGTVFGVPFINIDVEIYFWNLIILMPLSHLPKNNPVIVNAEDLETYIICKDCFFIISGPIPVPIFASPFHFHISTMIDASASVTIYHKRPGFGEFGGMVSFLTGLVKFFIKKEYLLSMKDFGGVQASKDFLVIRFKHEEYRTMLQLPKLLGKGQLKLNIAMDGKRFLIGFMNFFKTLNIKWLLQIVQLRQRIQNIDLSIGSLKFLSLQFAAATLNELKESKEWKQPVIGSGDKALIFASQKTPINSLMLKIMPTGLVNADLNLISKFKSGVIDINLEGRAHVNLEDMSNPLLIQVKCRIDLLGQRLLIGQAIISLNKVAISGKLNINFFGLLQLNGYVKAMVSSGEFRLSSKVNTRFVGVKLFDSSLIIRSGPRVSEVKVKATFMGSELAIELIRNDLSVKIIGRTTVNIRFNIDLGEIKVFGYSFGRFKLSAGVSVDIQIAFPGKSHFRATFCFLGVRLSTPKIGFKTKNARPDRIPDMVKNICKAISVKHVIKTLALMPLDLLKNIFRGFKKFKELGKQTIKLLGAFAKAGLKAFNKEMGNIANDFAKSAEFLAKKAIEVKKKIEEATKAVRETAEKAYKEAKNVVKKTLKKVVEVGNVFVKATKDVANAVRKVFKLDSQVKRLKMVVKELGREVSKAVIKIANIAKKMFDDIANGIRNAAGKIFKTVGGLFGKRSIYRRNALNDEKDYFERRRRDLQSQESNSRSQLQSKKRYLDGAIEEATEKYEARKKRKLEATAVNKNLDGAIQDENQKYALVSDIYSKGKCISGENDCHPQATCLRSGDDGQSFECLCKRGWIGDGRKCEKPIEEVTLVADKASQVGTAVTFVALTYSGTNVEYKFSFNGFYRNSTFQSHVFSAPGVYKVSVYARNNVSRAVDETGVFIQEPVSNIRLMIHGDKGACRPLEFMAFADGTNVTFEIDFGDNTTAVNTTQKAVHRFRVSGSYHVIVTGINLVCTLNKTFTVTIRNTYCDRLYCDLSRLELESNSLSDVANRAWQLAKSSKDNLPYSDPHVWKHLAVRNPLMTRMNYDSEVQSQMRIYDINGTTNDMSFVFVSLLASTIKPTKGDKTKWGMMENTVEQLMLDTIMPSNSDIINTLRVDIRQGSYFDLPILAPSRVRGAIDGYILGASGIANNISLKLSDIAYNYYCQNLENSNPILFNAKNRYTTYLELLKNKYPQDNGTFFNYIKRVAAKVIQGGETPITGDVSLLYFARYISSKLKTRNKDKLFWDPCDSWKSCSICLSFGAIENCSWCDGISKCVQEKDNSTCGAFRRYKNRPCQDWCSQPSNCHECTNEPYCGWCGDSGNSSVGKCVKGNLNGPLKPSIFCPAKYWHKNECDNNCPSISKSICSGFGKCKLGKCVCSLGRYGKDCSKIGCVYRVNFKDTGAGIARRFNLTISDLTTSNNHDKSSFSIAANMLITVSVDKISDLCLNYQKRKKFSPRFPRLLRGSKNVINKESYCGLYGSLSDSEENDICKHIQEREQCQKMPKCTWNAIDPCTGIMIEGCRRLRISTQILVPADNSIVSPISGKVHVGKKFAKISGWPGSQWEHYVVSIKLIRPKNITSLQAGNIIGLAGLKLDPTLPRYFELALTYKGQYINPEEYLLPCSPGCLQTNDLENGICDLHCNVSSCNYDRGDCVVLTQFRSKLSMPTQLWNNVLTKKSWFVLSKLHQMLKNSFIIERGPMSIFSLSKTMVSELTRSQTVPHELLYDTGNYSAIIIRNFKEMGAKNFTNDQLVVYVANLLISFGIEHLSPYLLSFTDIQSFGLSTKSLPKSSTLERALEFLKEYKLLTYLRVCSRSTNHTEYFHVEILQREEEASCPRYHYKADQTTESCDALHSCFGHGVCNNHGDCVCDVEYQGIECKTSICPNNCSTHGTCVDGSCVCEHGWEGKDCSKIKLCSPSCLEIWIGDGKCDCNCNISRCNYDGNDCLNVCTCPKSWLGDDNCDHKCNTAECKYDQGDCLKKKECNPGCQPSMTGDGFCDRECNVEKCSYDNGDCQAKETCSCYFSLQGNGVCDPECNKPSCMYDFGDCVSNKQVDKSCFQDCSPTMLGNGFCDLACNTTSCNFDGNDCIQNTKTVIQSACSPGCIASFLSDGSCDSICNVKACNFDGGDCSKPVIEVCNAGCNNTLIGDGKCQKECYVSQCSYDEKDCECAPGCHHTSLGNGICESQCLTESCLYDKNDCTCSPTNCPEELIGDGICTPQCNNKMCNYDGGDCSCASGCSLTSINDGWCDKECDVKECNFDGLDCGGCKADSHLDVCDLNAQCIVVNESLPFLECQCKAGFYGDGFECVEKGNCFNRSEICSQNAQCVNISGTSECSCNEGFTGSGMYCENINECASNQHNCSVNAICIDTNGSYSCDCRTGYSGNGFFCTDTNECIGNLSVHKCCANEKCTNTNGSYICDCREGWEKANETESVQEHQRNETTCNNSPNSSLSFSKMCVDVDECLEETDNCSKVNGIRNSKCVNTLGCFNCTCDKGYEGDGWFCTDVNECHLNNTCLENQLCKNTDGSFMCLCKKGWVFNETGTETCNDINECDLGINKCSEYAKCINTNGSYTCACRIGFQDVGKTCTDNQCKNDSFFQNGTSFNITKDRHYSDYLCACAGNYNNKGIHCKDIDECEWGTYDCPTYAPVCINTLGGYECQCDSIGNRTCQVFDSCTNNTCHPNMTCVATGVDHYCVCPSGYFEDPRGPAAGCVDRDECLNLEAYSCPDNAYCVNTIGSYKCRCRDGFIEVGGSCYEINECDSTLVKRISGRLFECRTGICSSVRTCLYRQRSSNSSRNLTHNTNTICACNPQNSKQLYCLEASLKVDTNYANEVTTALSFPWHTFYVKANSSSPVPFAFKHNCSESSSTCQNTPGSYKCLCNPGYHSDKTGKECYDDDECLHNHTCHANASCTNTMGSFVCLCKNGFTGNGVNCSDVNECELRNFSCHANATCINVIGGHTCQCIQGYYGNGSLCEDVNECLDDTLNNCHPRAVCSNYIGGYNCECTAGFKGDGVKCTDINECLNGSQLCSKRATCYNVPGSYICKCNRGWTNDGKNCTNIDECQLGTHLCIENSYCTDYDGSYTCNCKKGWVRQWFEPYGRCSACNSNQMCSGHGQCLRNGSCDCISYYGGSDCSVCKPEERCSGHGTCDFNGTCACDYGWTRQPLDCSNCVSQQLCSGFGRCNYDLATYSNKTCFCKKGYAGKNCSLACPIIGGESCGIHGDCITDHSSPNLCQCHTGYQWGSSSLTCIDINECSEGSNECVAPAICVNTDGSYRCECPSLVGWTFDGRRCTDINECQFKGVCDVHATCQNLPGEYRCNCKLGWRGIGKHPICKDIDECAKSSHNCPATSKCVNNKGSYYCVCNSGYKKVSAFQCMDINECSRGIHRCDRHSTCINTPGSWRCQCHNGWYPDPKNARVPRCRDVNECANKPNACPSVSSCTNTAGSYHCNCFNGWSNQGPHACIDVDECNRRPCPSNSQCHNTQGSYNCYCNSGYDPRPPTRATTCDDINECSRGTYSCPSYSHCVNTVGWYRCDCNRCFHTNGGGCRADCRPGVRTVSTYYQGSHKSKHTTSCGFLGMSRCTRYRIKYKREIAYRNVPISVSQRPGASCPCN